MKNPMTNSMTHSLKKLGELIESVEMAMLTTVDSDGHLRSRPMATARIGDEGEIWFLTRLDSPKSEQIRKHEQVNIAYSDPKKDRFVSLSGKGEIIQDREKIHELWSPAIKSWFTQVPAGSTSLSRITHPDDPGLALIRVRIEQAEIWDHLSSRMVPLRSEKIDIAG